MAMRIKFEGGRQLEKALAQIEKTATRKALARRALKKAADPILADYQANTVVATGTLVASEVSGTRLNARQARLNKRLGKAAVEIHIGTADPAGIQQEFGNRHQPAEPALGPAWEKEGGDAALARIGEELGSEIERTAARQARKRG